MDCARCGRQIRGDSFAGVPDFVRGGRERDVQAALNRLVRSPEASYLKIPTLRDTLLDRGVITEVERFAHTSHVTYVGGLEAICRRCYLAGRATGAPVAAPGGARTARVARRLPQPSITVLGMSADRGECLAIVATRAQFKRLFAGYVDDPAMLLAEATAPWIKVLDGGAIIVGPLVAGRSPQPRRSASSSKVPRITLVEAGWGGPATYRILTKLPFVEAVGGVWADAPAEFDRMVQSSGWAWSDWHVGFGLPLVWVDSQEDRRHVVDSLRKTADAVAANARSVRVAELSIQAARDRQISRLEMSLAAIERERRFAQNLESRNRTYRNTLMIGAAIAPGGILHSRD